MMVILFPLHVASLVFRVLSTMRPWVTSLGEYTCSSLALGLTKNGCDFVNILPMRWLTMQQTAGMLKLNAHMVGLSVLELLIELHLIYVRTR